MTQSSHQGNVVTPDPPVKPLRRHRAAMVLTAGAVIGASFVGMQASSGAATKPLPKYLQKFAHCPISNKKVTACVYASTGGTFQVGSASLTMPSNAVLNLGLISSSKATTAVLPTDGTPGLQAPTTEIPVAGSLVEVGATPVLAGLPALSVINLLTAHGVATSLPLVVDLSNPALGSTCTIGTTAAPLTVNLTDGTTAPPAPNMPITGSKGKLSSTNSGVITVSGISLVDNSFAAPGASGCGPLGLEDSVIDQLEGLPSAAGTNSAKLSGCFYSAPASLIRKYLG